MCVRGEDFEDAKMPEREWDIPETMNRLGDEQVETSPKKLYSLPAVERLRVPGHRGAVPGAFSQQ